MLAPVVAAFFPNARLLNATPLGEGNINDTYRLEISHAAPSETWLLQRLNTTVFKRPDHVAANIAALANYLSQHPTYPLEVSLPIPTARGGWLHTDGLGQCWRVMGYLPHTFAPERLPTPDQAREAAAAYGHFLNALRDFPVGQLHTTLPGFHDTRQRFETFRQVLDQNPAQRNTEASREIAQLFEAEVFANEVGGLLDSGQIALRPTHNDTKAGNVLLDERTQRAVAVIDWDTVMPGTLLSDFGDMVRTFVPDRYEDDPDAAGLQVRTEVWQALLEGFLDTARPTATERQHLRLGACWIISEQALRFLTDFLAGDVYYKVAYPEHNLVRARNQLALLERVVALR